MATCSGLISLLYSSNNCNPDVKLFGNINILAGYDAMVLLHVDVATAKDGSDGLLPEPVLVPDRCCNAGCASTFDHGLLDQRLGRLRGRRDHLGQPQGAFERGARQCQAAIEGQGVELDLETGHYDILDYLGVSDCGTVLHPLGLAAQTAGGAVMGFTVAGLGLLGFSIGIWLFKEILESQRAYIKMARKWTEISDYAYLKDNLE